MTESRPAPRSSQPRGHQTRERVLDAALKLLAEGGPAAVTHRAVADAAGVSLGATTYHFGSKSALLGEVLGRHLNAVRDRAGRLLATAPGSPSTPRRGDLAGGLTAYLTAGVRDRNSTLATFELMLECARDPALRRRLRGPRAATSDYAVSSVASLGCERPELDATLLIAAIMGIELEWLAQGERSAFAERIPALSARLAELYFPGSDK